MSAPKDEICSIEATINIGKLTDVKNLAFKKKAPRAVREIKKFARKTMLTKDVRIETALNKEIWKKGVRKLPKRVRVRISRKRNEDEDAKEKLYTVVSLVEMTSFKGLVTEKV